MIMVTMSMTMMMVMVATENHHQQLINIFPNQVIDKNGPPKTGGTGIKQLRENIAESKLSYEIMDDAAQVIMIRMMMVAMMTMMKETIVDKSNGSCNLISPSGRFSSSRRSWTTSTSTTTSSPSLPL